MDEHLFVELERLLGQGFRDEVIRRSVQHRPKEPMKLRVRFECKAPRSYVSTNRQAYRRRKAMELRHAAVAKPVYSIRSVMQSDWPE